MRISSLSLSLSLLVFFLHLVTFIHPARPADLMAKAKTSIFTLTEEVALPTSASTVQATIPIGSLIDVGDAQALEIVSVDYIVQQYDNGYVPYKDLFSATGGICVQLLDKNESAFISAADNNLISSMSLQQDASNNTSHSTDFYPDDFKGDTGRFVVNDEMYVIARASGGYTSDQSPRVTLRIRAKVVKLTTRDWMAISLETVQNE